MMTGQVFVNGRFLSQPVTGVQRFSAEIVGAIDALMAQGEWPETSLLTPHLEGGPPSKAVAASGCLRERPVGERRGHLWEQIDLPRAARGGVLVNLGNTAPLLAGRGQVVVIHDAGVFDTPSSYSWKFRLWYKGLQRALARAGAQIATVSEFSRQRIAACLDIDPALISVVDEGGGSHPPRTRRPADAGAPQSACGAIRPRRGQPRRAQEPPRAGRGFPGPAAARHGHRSCRRRQSGGVPGHR